MGFTSGKQTQEESEEKLMKEEQLRNQINDIIEGEIHERGTTSQPNQRHY